MPGAAAEIWQGDAVEAPGQLYQLIGLFLADQHLDPNPVNFNFAYEVVTNPGSPLSRAVNGLTEGGVRLTASEVDQLGCAITPQQPVTPKRPAPAAPNPARQAEGLMAQTQMQVEGFQDMMRAMRAETEGFGRDLAASADAIRQSRDETEAPAEFVADQVAALTAAMLARVHVAERRLEHATREASDLRTKLEEARNNARRDPLTDLPNRRAFEENFAAHAGAGEPMTIAVCDIDHFKAVNDQFGHAVGDRVLKAIATALSAACTGHMVARYGGEEFALLFAGISREHAHAVLDEAREAVAAKRYRLRETEISLGEVTFSAGLSETMAGEDICAAFQRADALLYAAKKDGRNCVRTNWH